MTAKNAAIAMRNRGWNLPLTQLSEGEMLAFFIAENALNLTGNTPYANRLKQALGKIAAMLPAQVSINLATLGENVRFQQLPFVSVEPEILQTLASTSINLESIEFDYYSPHKQQPIELPTYISCQFHR